MKFNARTSRPTHCLKGMTFLFERMCACTCSCLCICVCLQTFTNIQMCVDIKLQMPFFRCHPPCILRHALLLAWNWLSRIDWLAKTQASTSLCLPSAGTTSVCHCSWHFLLWMRLELRSLCLHGKHFINWYKCQSAPVENYYFQLGNDPVVSTSCSSLQIFVQTLLRCNYCFPHQNMVFVG